MRRGVVRIALLGTVLGALALWSAAPAGAVGETVRIRNVDVSAFPEVHLTVAIGSDTEAQLSDLHITENGVAVSAASIETLSTSGRSVDVVLAIDTSSSVVGAPLASAVAAATQFLAQLPASIRVGLVTFAGDATEVVPLTDDRSPITRALEGLSTTNGTALFAGVERAASMFSGQGQHNIIVLTDGANTERSTTVEDAIAAATAAGANVFTIGLASQALNVGVLENLANATGGTYSSATQANLSAIYAQLGTELSHQYLVTYRTAAAPGAQLNLSVGAFGAEDTTVVLTPDAPATVPAPRATGRPLALHGAVGLSVVLVLSFLAMFLLTLMIVGARARSRRQQDLARRMLAEDRPKDILDGDGKQVGVTWIPEPVAEVAQRIATAGGFAPNVEAKLERAGLPLAAGEFLAFTVGAAIAGAIVGQLFLQNVLFALIIAAVAAFIPNILLNVAIARRTARLHSQLADVVSLLASSLRAGHSFFQALDIVSKEIGEPAGPEFQRVMVEVRLGRSVQDALDAMAERVGSEDFKWAVLAVNIQREVGGNLAEILDIVAETVRERDTIRRQVKVLTAEGRLSVKILVALPFVVGLYCFKVNPDYMNLLISTRLGWIFLGTGASLMALGIFWARKVVKLDV